MTNDIQNSLQKLIDEVDFVKLIDRMKELELPDSLIKKVEQAITNRYFDTDQRVAYIIDKYLIKQGFYTHIPRELEELLNYIDKAQVHFVLIELFIKVPNDTIFQILEEEFVELYKNINKYFYERLQTYVKVIVYKDSLITRKSFLTTNSDLQEIDINILKAIDSGAIASAFVLIDATNKNDNIIQEYRDDFTGATYRDNREKWLLDFKSYLIQKFRYQNIYTQKKELINVLHKFIDDNRIFDYFSELADWGLEHSKFDLFVKDFIKGNISYGFYEELRSYANEAVNILFEQAIAEKKENNKIILQKFGNTQIGSWDMFGDFEWEFQPQINLLLGRNGYGKTHFLRYLLTILQDENVLKKQYPSSYSLGINWGEEEFFLTKKVFWAFHKIPVLAITDARFMDKSSELLQYERMEALDLEKDGAYFLLHQKPMQSLVNNLFISFASQFSEQKNAPIFDLMAEVISELSESKDKFAFTEIVNLSDSFRGAAYKVMVRTEASPNPIPLQKISQGTMSVMVIFGLIYDFLRKLHPNKGDVTKEWGIVFIDEVDAHLHPTWQRKIIGLLRKYFPNVQFFLTAHSPMIVAGCKYREVAVMRKKDDEQGFIVEQFHKHFIGADSGTVYQEIFDIDNVKDENYQKYLEMLPNAEEIRLRVEELNQKSELSENERQEFNQKINDLFYILQIMRMQFQQQSEIREVIEIGQMRAELEFLRNENNELKLKLQDGKTI